MKKYLLIGGTGFIGLFLARELLRDVNNQVIIIGRSESSSIHQLKKLYSNFLFIQMDLLQPGEIEKRIIDVDVIFYLSSGSYPGKTWESAQDELALNMQPFFLIFNQLAAFQLTPRIIFLSSGGTVYGNAPLSDEQGYREDSPTRPYVPYGIFKLSQEHLLAYYWEKAGIPYQIARIGNVYGPNFSANKLFGVINIWLQNQLQGQPITLFGDGNIIRDYIYIEDLVHRLIFLANSPKQNEIYNISTGLHVSLNEIIAILQLSKDQIRKFPARKSDIERVVLNGAKLENLCRLGQTNLEIGIAKTKASEKEKFQKPEQIHGKP